LFDSDDNNLYLQEMDVDPYPEHEIFRGIDHGVHDIAKELAPMTAPTKCESSRHCRTPRQVVFDWDRLPWTSL
jgi:hypothetical protein